MLTWARARRAMNAPPAIRFQDCIRTSQGELDDYPTGHPKRESRRNLLGTCHAYWPFDDTVSYGSGLSDRSGYGNDLHGTAVFTDDTRLRLVDGASELWGGDILNEIEVPFTISGWVWIKEASIGESARLITSDCKWNRYYGFWVQLAADGRLAVAYGDGGGRSSSDRRSRVTNEPLPFDSWVHVAAVVQGPQDMQIYVNGQEVAGTYSGSGGDMLHSGNELKIGPDCTAGAAAFPGAVKELRVYDRALELYEIEDMEAEFY